ncbi:MAG TPA: hypothetical protein VKV27_02770 [Solirubrobacteraceae bacterium]|nr:hypothetical protein [Solirubrobacteraceae bacterium]
MPADGAPGSRAAAHSERAARLMELLGLSEEELCTILDADPLSVVSGQLEHRHELAILDALLSEARERLSSAALRSWLRAPGAAGRPLDALLARDFQSFEDALEQLAQRGFVPRAPD